MSTPNEDADTASTFGANLVAGYNGPNRQNFAVLGLDAGLRNGFAQMRRGRAGSLRILSEG